MLLKNIAYRYERSMDQTNALIDKDIVLSDDVLNKIENRLKSKPGSEHGFYLRGKLVGGKYIVSDIYLPNETKIFNMNGDLSERTVFKIDSFIKHYKEDGQFEVTFGDICRELHGFKNINDEEYRLLNEKYDLNIKLKDIEGVRWHNGISVHEPAFDNKELFTLYAHSHVGTTFNEKEIDIDKKQGEGIIFNLNENGKIEWRYYAGSDVSPTTKRIIAVADKKIIEVGKRHYKVSNNFIKETLNEEDYLKIKSLINKKEKHSLLNKNQINQILYLLDEEDKKEFIKNSPPIEAELASDYFDIQGLQTYLKKINNTEPLSEIIKNFEFHIPILMPEKHNGHYIARFNGDLNIFKYLKDPVRYIEQDPDNVFRIHFADTSKEPLTLVKCSDYRPTINQKNLNIEIKQISISLLTEELVKMLAETDNEKKIIKNFSESFEFIEYEQEELSQKVIETDYYESADQFYDIFSNEQFKEKLIKLNIFKEEQLSNYKSYIGNHAEKIKEFYRLFIEKENIVEIIKTFAGKNISITLYKSGRDTVVSSDISDESIKLKDLSAEEIVSQLHLPEQEAKKIIEKILSLPDPMNYYQSSKNISGEMFLDLLQFIVKENNIISEEESTGFGSLLISNLIKLDRKEFTKTTSAINKINELTSTTYGIKQERTKQKLLLLLMAIHDPHTLIEHSIDMANTFDDFLIFVEERYPEFKDDKNTEELQKSIQGIKEKLLLGVIFHDIGKLYIDQILLKKKGSTFNKQLIGKNRIEQEQLIIDHHIDHGRAIFKDIFEICDEIILNCITRHHPPTKKEIEDYEKEKTNNPKAKSPERTPYEQVVNFFDDLNAMFSERGYKNKMPLIEVKKAKNYFFEKYSIIESYLKEKSL